jgi:hypothetical protein
MPNFDGTGPVGMGRMVGRGLGRGLRRGMGRMAGRGLGLCNIVLRQDGNETFLKEQETLLEERLNIVKSQLQKFKKD